MEATMCFQFKHGLADISILSQPMLKLKTHSGFRELFRFWYVYECKYGSILWL